MRPLILLFLSILFTLGLAFGQSSDWFLPIMAGDRQSWESVRLTRIGCFGLYRKPRPHVPAHLHTGIDIMRPSHNYRNEPVLAAAPGKVVSVRDDGPFAQIIIEHQIEDEKCVWTVYEHISGITVSIGDKVFPDTVVARFMNKNELDQYGWQFDHLHFEVLKQRPRPLQPDKSKPFRLYATYSLECYTESDLRRYYYNPIEFFEAGWNY